MNKLKESILTQLVFDKQLYLSNINKLHTGLFGDYGFMFDAYKSLVEEGVKPSFQNISERTENKEHTYNLLTDISKDLTFSMGFDDELEMLIETHKESEIKHLIYEININVNRKSSNDLIDELIQKLLTIRTEEEVKYKKLIDILPEVNRLIDRNANSEDINGIPTGFRDIDNFTWGLQKGEFNIIAGRPSMGKTAFSVQIAKNAAQKNIKSAVISLEMSDLSLVLRIVSSETKDISSKQIQRQKLNRGHINEISDTFSRLDIPLYISQSKSALEAIINEIRILVIQEGVELIVIDYIGLILTKIHNREQEISHISRSLLAITKEMNICMLVLSQLNRSVETRGGDKRPMLSDLRDSGSLEQDADNVIMLYRPEYYGFKEDEDHQSTEGVCEVIFAKGRNQGVGVEKLHFNKLLTKFSDYEQGANTKDDLWT